MRFLLAGLVILGCHSQKERAPRDPRVPLGMVFRDLARGRPTGGKLTAASASLAALSRDTLGLPPEIRRVWGETLSRLQDFLALAQDSLEVWGEEYRGLPLPGPLARALAELGVEWPGETLAPRSRVELLVLEVWAWGGQAYYEPLASVVGDSILPPKGEPAPGESLFVWRGDSLVRTLFFKDSLAIDREDFHGIALTRPPSWVPRPSPEPDTTIPRLVWDLLTPDTVVLVSARGLWLSPGTPGGLLGFSARRGSRSWVGCVLLAGHEPKFLMVRPYGIEVPELIGALDLDGDMWVEPVLSLEGDMGREVIVLRRRGDAWVRALPPKVTEFVD